MSKKDFDEFRSPESALPERQRRKVGFLTAAIILAILFILGLSGATLYIFDQNERDRINQQTITAIYQTNTAVAIAVAATETAKAWTPTPSNTPTPTEAPTRKATDTTSPTPSETPTPGLLVLSLTPGTPATLPPLSDVDLTSTALAATLTAQAGGPLEATLIAQQTMTAIYHQTNTAIAIPTREGTMRLPSTHTPTRTPTTTRAPTQEMTRVVTRAATMAATPPADDTATRTPMPTDTPFAISTMEATPAATMAATMAATPPANETATHTPSQTPIHVAVVNESLKIVNASGVEIGDGTLRVYAPSKVMHSQTARIELELHLDNRYITPTPFGAQITIVPVTRVTSTPSGDKPTPTPRVPIHEATVIPVYQRMGASLFCSPASFDGCDNGKDPNAAKLVSLTSTTWSWIISPKTDARGLQDLQIELWDVKIIGNGPEQAHIVWHDAIRIEIEPVESNTLITFARENLGAVLVALIGAVGTIAAALIGLVNVTRAKQAKASTKTSTKQVSGNTFRTSAFISYRRKASWGVATRIRDALTAKGADVFLDIESIHEGRFETVIKNAIKERDYFVLVIAPNTFESEWVVKETLYAIECKRKIIPVLDGFDLYRDKVADELSDLRNFNAVTLVPEYYDAGIERLAEFMGLS
jgi:hypothetical protein